MTDEQSFDRIVRSWLETGPSQAPERAVDNILRAVETAAQVRPRPRLPSWRRPTLNWSLSFAAVAMAIVLVAGATIWLRGPRNSVIGPGAGESPTPSGTLAQSPSASPIATPAPSPTPRSSPTPTPTPTPTAGAAASTSAAPSATGKAAIAISEGFDFTCALMRGGNVRCWGLNSSGQLGNGTTEDSSSPVDVVGLSGVTAIALGGYHACAITAEGGVKCWGKNSYQDGHAGQLGNGTTMDSSTPVDVVGLDRGVTAIAGGWQHTCALTNAGQIKCWGANDAGQLGNDTTTFSTTPTDVALTGGVTAISASGGQSCALMSGGGVKCWGNNKEGQLGNGSTTPSSIPVDVSGLARDALAIDVGGAHSCAITTAGTAKCWGYNPYGQLGNGETTDRNIPVDVVGLTGISAIAAGGNLWTCALTNVGGVKCWGYNAYGQLGNGAVGNNSLVPTDVVDLASGVTAITTHGFQHACALMTNGGVKCWGGNEAGELGDGTKKDSSTPVDVQGL